MPYTQHRFLRLLEAAEHFQSRCFDTRDFINSACTNIATGQLSLSDGLTQITTYLSLTKHDDTLAAIFLSEERTRYNLTHARNESERLRIARRRARAKGESLGILPQQSISPNTIPSSEYDDLPYTVPPPDHHRSRPVPKHVLDAVERTLASGILNQAPQHHTIESLNPDASDDFPDNSIQPEPQISE